MSEDTAAEDGTTKRVEVDVQLAMLNHYIYTHQLTLPDSEIWKAIEYVERLARLGARVVAEAYKYRESLEACPEDNVDGLVYRQQLFAGAVLTLTASE